MTSKSKFVLFLVLALCLTIVGGVAAQDDQITLRVAWWGDDARHAKYNEIFDLYEELNPNINIERELSGWGGYWDKLATQTSAGNSPDMIIMHLNFIESYTSRGALVNLNPYVESGALDISEFGQGAIEAGRVGDGLYMVTLGLTPRAVFYNPVLFEEAGVDLPTEGWTWEDYVATAQQLSEGLGEDRYGAFDDSENEIGFPIFLGQRGKRFYEGEALGFEKQDLIDWWSMWDEMRSTDAAPPAEITSESQAQGGGHAEHLLTRGVVAMTLAPGNQFKLFQEYNEDELEIAPLPRQSSEDAIPYNYAGGAFMAISSQSEHPDEVVELINWFVNDADVARLYNGEHGPPASRAMQEVLIPDLEPADQKLYAFYEMVEDYVQPQPPQATRATEVLDAFARINDDFMFGNLSVEEAVDLFFEEADFILG